MIIVAFGFSANAQDVTGASLNIGNNNVIDAGLTAGSAIGDHLRVYSNYSLAIGNGDTLTQSGHNSLVVGGANKMGGSGSISVGLNNQVLTDYSIGFGRYVKTSAQEDGCMAIGVGLYGTQTRPALYMENQYDNSLMIGFLSTKPTFTVSPSYTDYLNGGTIFDRTGKIAIGDVPIPDIAAKLHIRADEDENAGIILESKNPESSTFIRMRDEYHGIEVDDAGAMRINAGENPMTLQSNNITLSGKVGINTTNESDTYTLAVDGGILTNEVLIREVDDWYDNVFEKDYNLLSLTDLQQFINSHGHLPEVPSETEVKEEGLKMAEMQGLLLKKIEELTLYTLKQQEEIEALKKLVEELKGK